MTHMRRVAPALSIAFVLLLALPTAFAQDKKIWVMAELTSKLDTKTAKVGDAVTAETTQKGKLPDGTQIPRGAKLIGIVTDVTTEKDGINLVSLAEQLQPLAFAVLNVFLDNADGVVDTILARIGKRKLGS